MKSEHMEPSPAAEASPQERKEAPVMYEELAELEKQFDDVDVEICESQFAFRTSCEPSPLNFPKTP